MRTVLRVAFTGAVSAPFFVMDYFATSKTARKMLDAVVTTRLATTYVRKGGWEIVLVKNLTTQSSPLMYPS